jgi:hypothetical protein
MCCNVSVKHIGLAYREEVFLAPRLRDGGLRPGYALPDGAPNARALSKAPAGIVQDKAAW